MSDLLTPLLDAIATVRKRITNHETLLEGDETRTRVSLVDPILVALGWNPADPNLVVLEHKIGGKSADYALLVEGGKPAVIVEAKSLARVSAVWINSHKSECTQLELGFVSLR